MKHEMNYVMRFALVALIAFAMPSVANAQFGKLKGAVKSETKSSSNSAPDFFKKKQQQQNTETTKAEEPETPPTTTAEEDPYGGNQVEMLMKRKQEASAKQDAEREARAKAGSKIIECRRDQQIGSWHYKENKIESLLDGESYILDAAAGVIRTGSGKTVATLTADGLNIPSIDAKVALASGGGISINGESIGKVTSQDVYIYGRRLGNFFSEAPRTMVAFFLLYNYAQPEVRANMKRTQYSDGNFMNASGTRIGYIKGGMIYNLDKLFPKLGSIHYSDDETVIGDTQFRVGAVQYDGTVNDNDGNKIGMVKDNGDILNVAGKKVAHVGTDGKITDASGKFLAQFSGTRPMIAAVAYYFFFKSKIR